MTLQRLRYNFIAGSVTNITTTGASGVITFSNVNGLGNVTVTDGSQYLPITINPPNYSSSAPAEVIWVTSYTANNSTANVLRAQEGTSNGGTWTGATYTHGPTTLDFDVSNLTSSGQLKLNNGLATTYLSVNNDAFISNNLVSSGFGVLHNANINGVLTTFTQNNINTLSTGKLTVNNSIVASGTGTAISAPNGNISAGGSITSYIVGATEIATGAINTGGGSLSIGGALTVSSGIVPYAYTSNAAIGSIPYTGQPVLTMFITGSGILDDGGRIYVNLPNGGFPNGVLSIYTMITDNNNNPPKIYIASPDSISKFSFALQCWQAGTEINFQPRPSGTSVVVRATVYGF